MARNVYLADLARQGRSDEALRLLEAANATEGPKGSAFTALARVEAGGILLDKGQASLALTEARRASQEGHR
jgi:hypothetical protein